MGDSSGFEIQTRDGMTDLVVTGPWSRELDAILESGSIDRLVLNHVYGFCQPDLSFLRPWPITSLKLLDRRVREVRPLTRLAATLTGLSLEVDRRARLDLSGFKSLERLAGAYVVLRDSLKQAVQLREATLFYFTDLDLGVFAATPALEALTLKVAPKLESLAGIERLSRLASVWIQQAPQLKDVSPLRSLSLSLSLRELRLELCRSLRRLDDLTGLTRLAVLEIGNCGDIESLAPLRGLHALEALSAWGDTRICDADLSPLGDLPLRDLRMKSRREYRPSLTDLKRELALHA